MSVAYALTVHRPWTWAICRPDTRAKRTENRSWPPPAVVIGQDIVIHAGEKYDQRGHETIARLLGVPPPPSCPMGLVAVVKVVGFDDADEAQPTPEERDSLQERAAILEYDAADLYPTREAAEKEAIRQQLAARDPWRNWSDRYGWHLANVRPLPWPVPCRGWQGLWRLTAEQRGLVLEQLGELGTRS